MTKALAGLFTLAASAGNTTFHHIVALLVLTGQRRGEIVSLKWDWIDGDVITLPETKGGRAHRFPLSEVAQKVLEKIPQASEYVFPASVSQVRGQPTRVLPRLTAGVRLKQLLTKNWISIPTHSMTLEGHLPLH